MSEKSPLRAIMARSLVVETHIVFNNRLRDTQTTLPTFKVLRAQMDE